MGEFSSINWNRSIFSFLLHGVQVVFFFFFEKKDYPQHLHQVMHTAIWCSTSASKVVVIHERGVDGKFVCLPTSWRVLQIHCLLTALETIYHRKGCGEHQLLVIRLRAQVAALNFGVTRLIFCFGVSWLVALSS